MDHKKFQESLNTYLYLTSNDTKLKVAVQSQSRAITKTVNEPKNERENCQKKKNYMGQLS